MKSKVALVVSIFAIAGGLGYSQLSFTDIADPDQMTPSEIYARCYAKLLRKPIPGNDATVIALRSQTFADAENACAALLNKATLGADGRIANVNDLEAIGVLTTMQMLHNSWFASQTLIVRRSSQENKLLLDVDEPGLYWTRALLRAGVTADSVLKHNKALRSIRLRSDDGGATNFQARSFFNYSAKIIGVKQRDPLFRLAYMNDIKLNRRDGTNYATMDVPNAQLSEFGEMVGVKDQSPLTIKRLIIPNTGDTAVDTILRDPALGPNLDVDLHGHFGGGIIGSIVYGLKNSNLLANQLPDSYTMIDRRFAARVFQDLLCYQLPVLKPEDVDVVPGSNFAFQQSRSCMQCHATIDELAMIQKN